MSLNFSPFCTCVLCPFQVYLLLHSPVKIFKYQVKHHLLFCLFVLAILGLRCYVWAFSACGEQGPLFVVVCRLLIVVASLVEERGLLSPHTRATTPEPTCHNHRSPHTLLPVLRNRHTTIFNYPNHKCLFCFQNS